jgi:hypothetical protein
MNVYLDNKQTTDQHNQNTNTNTRTDNFSSIKALADYLNKITEKEINEYLSWITNTPQNFINFWREKVFKSVLCRLCNKTHTLIEKRKKENRFVFLLCLFSYFFTFVCFLFINFLFLCLLFVFCVCLFPFVCCLFFPYVRLLFLLVIRRQRKVLINFAHNCCKVSQKINCQKGK